MRANMLKSVAVSVATVAILGAFGGDSFNSADATSNNVTGSLKEWTVETDATTAKAGEVVFTITNVRSLPASAQEQRMSTVKL